VTGYAELQVTTNASFLRGASHAEELFAQAKMLGLPALGITDRNSLAGMGCAHQRAAETEVRLVVGCCLVTTSACAGWPTWRKPRRSPPWPPATCSITPPNAASSRMS
jgi:error-prone DNA polymerase